MARVEIPVVVLQNGLPAAGASVTIRKRSDNSLAVVYQTESGGTTYSNPLTSDGQGAVNGWVERGAYVAQISGSGISSYDENFEASPAEDGSIDAGWLAPGIGNDNHYVYVQGTPDTDWGTGVPKRITHNLGKFPNVTVVDSAGTEWTTDVTHVDNNTVEVKFAFATSGKVYFN